MRDSGTQEVNATYFSRDPYGQLQGASGSGGTLNPEAGFAGASTPNASGGFVYLRNRWYDPQTGRFLTQDPIGLAGGVNLYGYAGNDPINFSDPFGLDPCEASSAWTECLAQALANWGASRGGVVGAVALNAGAAINVGLEASGLNAAASAGDAIGSGRIVEGGAGVALAMAPVGRVLGSGLRGASAGLTALFQSGSIRSSSIIGIRSTLLRNGFTQSLTRDRRGYVFRNAKGEVVRIMRRRSKWDVRVQNAAGNYLDEAGNVAPPLAAHGISVQSK